MNNLQGSFQMIPDTELATIEGGGLLDDALGAVVQFGGYCYAAGQLTREFLEDYARDMAKLDALPPVI
jgi:hypothetical protein